MKTLYFTAMDDLPRLLEDADAAIENGDLNQGIAHQYEYNGELAPWANGMDKQEIVNAAIRVRILADAFRLRLNRASTRTLKGAARVRAALVRYIFGPGNHDKWLFHGKRGLPLKIYEGELREQYAKEIFAICQEEGIDIPADAVRALTDEYIIRVGDSRMVNIDGITVGVKHPHKGGTRSRSSRIQEVVEFIWRRFDRFADTVARNSNGFAMVYVANFHTAASVHIGKFGRTLFGVMTGAYLHDTEFESEIDKVVEYGPAIARVKINPEGRILYAETEFVDHINDEDREFVLSDRLDTAQVLDQSVRLFKRIKVRLPWR